MDISRVGRFFVNKMNSFQDFNLKFGTHFEGYVDSNPQKFNKNLWIESRDILFLKKTFFGENCQI